MRNIEEIKKDIKAAEETHAESKREVANTKGGGPAPAIRALISSLIFSVLLSLLIPVLLKAEMTAGGSVRTAGIVIVAVLAVLFLVLLIIATVKYARYKRSVGASVAATVLGALFLACAGYGVFKFALGNGLTESIKSETADKLLDIYEITSVDTLKKALLYALLFLAASSFIILLISVFKMISAARRKAAYTTEVKRVADEVGRNAARVAALREELSATEKEAADMYNAEIAKDEPDATVMESLSAVGFSLADEWLFGKKKADDAAEGKIIYERERAKDVPDAGEMRRASELGDPDASLWLALKQLVECVKDIGDYTNMEIDTIFKDIRECVVRAEGCEDDDIRRVIKAYAGSFGYGPKPNEKEMGDAVRILRELKKSENLTAEGEVLTGVVMKNLIEKADKTDNNKKNTGNDPDDYEKRYDTKTWDPGYVRRNKKFCVAWCNDLTDDAVKALMAGDYRKAFDKLAAVDDAARNMPDAIPAFKQIHCVSSFAEGCLVACAATWREDDNRRELATICFRIAELSNDEEMAHFAGMAADFMEDGMSFEEFRSSIFPNFPREIINKFLLPLDRKYEALFNSL